MAEAPHHSHWTTLLVTARLDHWARLVGATIALRFRNRHTGLACPSVPTIAETVGCSTSTVKRAVKALEAAGWIERTEGRGAGNMTTYQLRWPENVSALPAASDPEIVIDHPASKGATGDLSADRKDLRKGASLIRKEFTGEPFYRNQKFNQKRGARPAPSTTGTCPVSALRQIGEDEIETVADWDRQLAAWGLPPLRGLTSLVEAGGKTGWLWPLRWIPSDPAELDRVERYARWLLDRRGGLAHAA